MSGESLRGLFLGEPEKKRSNVIRLLKFEWKGIEGGGFKMAKDNRRGSTSRKKVNRTAAGKGGITDSPYWEIGGKRV